MFHVELRKLPHVARAFNLSAEELQARIVRDWIAGRPVALNDRAWDPQRARLTIYEGPALAREELGLGRGWAEVTRSGQEVTSKLLAQAQMETPIAELKRAVLARLPLNAPDLLDLAEGDRPSQRLALAEQALWELLHEGRAQLARKNERLGREDWQSTLLSWSTWADPATGITVLPSGVS